MMTVPFTIDVYAGFGECRGLLKSVGGELVLEYQTVDTVAGVLEGKVREVRIPFSQVVGVELRKGWLGTSWLGVKLVIQAASLAAVEGIPGMSHGRVELKIASKHVELAEEFLEDLHSERPS